VARNRCRREKRQIEASRALQRREADLIGLRARHSKTRDGIQADARLG